MELALPAELAVMGGTVYVYVMLEVLQVDGQ